MADALELTTIQAYQIADSFAQASARLLDFRVDHRDTLSEAAATALEKSEDRLDHLVVLFRGYGIQLIGARAEKAVAELTLAIETGKKTLAVIGDVKQALGVADAMVDLANSVLARDPEGILTAAHAVHTAASLSPAEKHTGQPC